MPSEEAISAMTVREVVEFASEELKQNSTVLEKLTEAEIDGEALLLLTDQNVHLVLPGLPIGPCLKLMSRLKASITPTSAESPLPVRPPLLPVTPPSQVCVRPPLSPMTPPSQVRVRSPSPDTDSDRENQAPAIVQSQPETTPVRPSQLQSLPYSGEFPIERLVFGPASQQAFRTGIVRREAKTEILNVLHLKIMQLSCDQRYTDRRIRYDAAEALIAKYPQLREGRSVRDAVLSWRNSLTCKGKSIRRRLDKDSDPKLAEERRKYQASRLNLSQSPARRTPSMPVLDEDEVENQRMQQQQMKAEFMKPVRDRNQRYVSELFRETFPLRRRDIINNSPHLSQVLRDWPALKNPSMIIQDLLAIDGTTTSTCMKDIPSSAILTHAEEYVARLPRGHPMLRVLYPHERDEDDKVVTDVIAVALLPYFLPTRAKKTLVETHRFLIDIYPADFPMEELARDVSGRAEPWILIRGTWSAVDRIQIVADGVCVCTVPDISTAAHVVVGLHYVQDTQYNRQVKLALKYLEQCVCGLKRVGKEDYREIVSFKNVLDKL